MIITEQEGCAAAPGFGSACMIGQSLKTVCAPYHIQLPVLWRRKHLSPAEQRVVMLVATGLSTKEVATRLNKSTATVRNQLYEAMRKLDVHTRYELIAMLRPMPASAALSGAPETEAWAYAI